jgi:hypothetical protein
MTMLWRAFTVWFASLMALFLAINLAGFLLCGVGEGKRWVAGFPCLIAEWIILGEYRESHFYPSSIFINTAISVMVSATLAWLCASSRAYRAAATADQLSTWFPSSSLGTRVGKTKP